MQPSTDNDIASVSLNRANTSLTVATKPKLSVPVSRVLIDRASSHAGSPDLAGPLTSTLSTHGASFHAATAAVCPQFSQPPTSFLMFK